MTVVELLAKSGLDIERGTLARKLTGEYKMRTTEAEILANALSVAIAWIPQGAKKADESVA